MRDRILGGAGVVWLAPRNLYIGRFVLGWKVLGLAQRLNAAIVNDADGFVICCRATTEEAMATMGSMTLKLTVNETTMRVRETFDFLGYTFRPVWSYRSRRMQLGTRPAKGRVQRVCRAISRETADPWKFRDEQEQVGLLNQILTG